MTCVRAAVSVHRYAREGRSSWNRNSLERGRPLNKQEIRHRKILELIRNESIHSQCELKSRLHEEGIEVTQATLSRDLKLLGVIRAFDPKKGYVYTHPFRMDGESPLPVEPGIDGIEGVSFSGNLAVIKTKLGYATGVAFEIDRLGLPEVLGTVGGDDTLLVVLKEDCDREEFLRHLKPEILSAAQNVYE
jgi:transcriptional regulator of arginine metabolism